MRINSGNLGMDSARLYKSSSTTRTAYVGTDVSGQWNDNTLASFSNFMSDEETERKENVNTDVSTDNTLSDTFQRLNNRNIDSIANAKDTYTEFSKLHQLMIRHIFELLFGKKHGNIKGFEEEAMSANSETFSANAYQFVTTTYSSSSCYAESETTSFRAAGTVQTVDGRSIDININVSMSRSFTSYYEKQYSSTILQVCDPLVINYGGNIADLDKEYSFFFDLDTDGQEEKIARLTGDSGFLALDLNNDGIINDGSELFGTKSGDGFKDLSTYDEDGNGWIDEGDSIFEKLRIWSKDAEGNDVLYTLKDQNVGAIYTGAIDTQFSINDMDNSTLGYVRKTGVFLFEDGNTGTVQHIDLVS